MIKMDSRERFKSNAQVFADRGDPWVTQREQDRRNALPSMKQAHELYLAGLSISLRKPETHGTGSIQTKVANIAVRMKQRQRAAAISVKDES